MSTIRRPVQIAAPTRTVWNSIFTAEGLTKWLAAEGRVDAREGGRFIVKFADGTEATGMINAWRPTAKAEILFDRHAVAPWGGTTLAIALARDGAESALHLQHSGASLDDDAVSAPLDAQWKLWLTRLRDVLEA